MKYWLIKSEPGAWSWDDHVKKGVEHWDGIRNHQANNNMKAMKKGDRAFFYHSVNEKSIVGVVEVVKEHYPDPTDNSRRFGMVDVKALVPARHPEMFSNHIESIPNICGYIAVATERLWTDSATSEICSLAGE